LIAMSLLRNLFYRLMEYFQQIPPFWNSQGVIASRYVAWWSLWIIHLYLQVVLLIQAIFHRESNRFPSSLILATLQMIIFPFLHIIAYFGKIFQSYCGLTMLQRQDPDTQFDHKTANPQWSWRTHLENHEKEKIQTNNIICIYICTF